MEKRIAEAVNEEIKIHGFKFTMDDVTARLHMSKSSLYKLVGSKDKLVHDFVSYLRADFSSKLEEVLAEDSDICTKLERYVCLYVNLYKPYGNNSFLELKQFYYEEWERWREFQQENIDSILAVLQQGINAGAFRPLNIQLVRCVIIASVMSLSDYQTLEESNLSLADALQEFADLLFNGIMKK